jgi:hypothetical protein
MPSYYGRRVTSGDVDFGIVGVSTQRACVFNAITEDGWGYRLGIWAGKYTSTSAGMRIAAWATNATTRVPTSLLAYTASISVNTLITYGGDGQSYAGDISAGTNIQVPGASAIKLTSGTLYSLGIVATTAQVGHAMVAASKISGLNESFYQRTSTTTPQNPNGYTSVSTEGWLSAWIEYQANRAPVASASTPSGTITTTTPTFTGTWSDADETYGDAFKQFRIRVYRSSDNALMWDSLAVSASAAEISAKTMGTAGSTRTYGFVNAGTSLSAGVTYYWTLQVSDAFDTWSAVSSAVTFTVNGGGTVTGSTPTGKQEAVNGFTFSAAYTHASSLSLDRVQVRILQDATVVATGSEVTKSVASGGTATCTFAESGFSNLSWGVANYSWQMRVRDTSALWSSYCTAVPFSTNAAPSIPTGLSPNSSTQGVSAYPLLQCSATDSDDTTATGLVVKARIKNSSGTVLYTRSMTYSGTSGTWQYQVTSTDFASYATYRWDAYSGDGTLWSGTVNSEASAVASAEATIIYQAGPSITITSPTEAQVLTSDTPTITWTVSNQASFVVSIVRVSDSREIYNSGTVTSTTGSHSIPSGYLYNGISYSLTVTVTNTTAQTSSSAARAFSLAYTQPSAITGFLVTPAFASLDGTSPTAIALSWDAWTPSNGVFTSFLIGRKLTGADDSTQVILARLTSSSATTYTDWLPASGVDYEYTIRGQTLKGSDTLTTNPSRSQAQVTLQNVVICHATDGGTLRAALTRDDERAFSHVDDLVLERVWGESAPVAIYGVLDYGVVSGTFRIAADAFNTGGTYLRALQALRASKASVCYRDDRGRRIFGVITKLAESDQRVQAYTVDLEIVEVAYTEGV